MAARSPPEAEKLRITAACQRFIDEILKPRFLPAIDPTAFNYCVDTDRERVERGGSEHGHTALVAVDTGARIQRATTEASPGKAAKTAKVDFLAADRSGRRSPASATRPAIAASIAFLLVISGSTVVDPMRSEFGSQPSEFAAYADPVWSHEHDGE